MMSSSGHTPNYTSFLALTGTWSRMYSSGIYSSNDIGLETVGLIQNRFSLYYLPVLWQWSHYEYANSCMVLGGHAIFLPNVGSVKWFRLPFLLLSSPTTSCSCFDSEMDMRGSFHPWHCLYKTSRWNMIGVKVWWIARPSLTLIYNMVLQPQSISAQW